MWMPDQLAWLASLNVTGRTLCYSLGSDAEERDRASRDAKRHQKFSHVAHPVTSCPANVTLPAAAAAEAAVCQDFSLSGCSLHPDARLPLSAHQRLLLLSPLAPAPEQTAPAPELFSDIMAPWQPKHPSRWHFNSGLNFRSENFAMIRVPGESHNDLAH